MEINIRYTVSVLLALSFGLLGVLIPGGPVETRSFSHIDPLILGIFNTFLTVLGLVSILLIYSILKNMKWAYTLSAVCGACYFLVYALDLAMIFPVSPDPMPQALFIIEVLATIASIPLMLFSVQGALKNINGINEQSMEGGTFSTRFVYLVFFLVIAGIAIVVFATKSAMGE
jgi:uncharacterized membrane protein